MNQITTISKNTVLPAEQDYRFLRTEGQKYIESLATSLWTDFNEHDPGITILELLCYALTELGYRTGFDIKDLLTAADGKIPAGQCFFTAKNILTVNPLTVRDYRKLLIDLPEIQNAWMLYNYDDVGQEVPFYADCEKDQLTIDDGTKAIADDHRIKLSGLYKSVVDLESSLQWGDLNNTSITYRVPEGDIQDHVVTLLFHYFEQIDRDDYNSILSAVTGAGYATAIQLIQIPPRKTDLHHWDCFVTVQYKKNNVATTAILQLIIRIDSLSGRNELQKADAYLQGLFTADFLHERFTGYQAKYFLIQDTLDKAKSALMAHRNLCEDFKEMVTVSDLDIALCVDIDVSPDADIEQINANIFYDVQEYFSPSVHFYTLKELLSKGETTDEIFEGPVLSHGFIDNDELDKAQLRQVIRISDLVKIIMGIEGVLAVKNLVITQYDEDGEPVLPSEIWCLGIPAGYKAILNIDRSKIIFYKGRIPLKAKIAESLDTLKYLEAIHERNKLYGAEDDLPVPDGNYKNLEDYYSVQNELPETYGVGIAGLPASAPDARIAQARQLKAYLMFYDQLLADFFSQLNGAKRLLSTDKTLVQTYFTQYLAEADPPFYQDGVKNVTVIYTDPPTLKNLLSGSQINTPEWRNLIEPEQTFYDRRNGFLDHLLARFAASFSDYVLMMYQVEFDLQQSEAISNTDIINAKIDFLDHYPDISSNRGKAMNYDPVLMDPVTGLPVLDSAHHLPEPDKAALWSPDNISGLEKRASLFTGIPLPQESRLAYFLFCHSIADIAGQGVTNDPPYSFAFYDEKDEPILQSVRKDYASETDAMKDINELTPLLTDTKYYYAQKQGDGTYLLFVTNDVQNKTTLLATDGKTYARLADANKAKNALVKFFEAGCNKEGFYLVEHLLLRPRKAYAGSPYVFLAYTEKNIKDNEGNIVAQKQFSFYFLDAQNRVLLQSVKADYPDALSAGAAAEALAANLTSPKYYFPQRQNDNTYKIGVKNNAGDTTPQALTPSAYATPADAGNAVALLVSLFTVHPAAAGFYGTGTALPATLPATASADFNLMEVCLGKDCRFCGEQDPYSFRASLVLPYWPQRFRNIIFRRYFEEIAQTEAPAHTALQICWVNNPSMRHFEVAYKDWLDALSDYSIDPSDNTLLSRLKDKNDRLIYILQHLYSEYPLATLHDCEESLNPNIVILGSTVLGTYKN